MSHTVRIQGAPNEVASLGFEVTYDNTILEYMDYTRSGCITDFDFFDCLEPEAGVVRCGGYEAGEDVIPQGVNCDVVGLQFVVVDCESGTCPVALYLQELVDDVSVWPNSTAVSVAVVGVI